MKRKNGKIFKLERQDWQLAMVLTAVLLLALIAHLATLKTLGEFDKANSKVMGVYDGTGHLQSLDRNLIELAHDQNYFIQTGDESYAVAAENAMRGIEDDLGKVRRFFQNELTRRNLEQLESLVNRKVQFHRQVMNAYREGGKGALGSLPDLGQGTQLQDSILLLTDTLRHYHRQHLLETMDKKRILAQRLRWVSFAGVVFVFLIAAFSIYYLLRTAKRRQELMNHLIEAKEKAEQAAFLKEQFIANMSHEIRTPLNAIIGFTSLLERTELQPRQGEFVHSIKTSGENLLSIINDILDFSKIEAGALRLEKIPFNLPSLVHSMENMFRFRAKEKHLNFSIEINDDVPGNLLGDPTRLTQILSNLLGNAFKFTDKGEVALLVHCEQKDTESALISITVKDTGIGIPPEKLTDIFDRFQQASSDTTRKYGGAGLGLTITKQLVEAQHGTIGVESNPDIGTAFTIKIPYGLADEKSNRSQIDPLLAPAQAEKISILLVEDNPMNRRVAELLLDEWGYSHAYAANGRIATDMLREKKYDLVLMDIQMPEMDGYTATKYIREELGLSVPIIATTAHAFAGEREKCISFGMNDYISKPLREVELLELIKQYVVREKRKEIADTAIPAGVVMPKGFDRQYVLDISKGKPELLREMARIFLSQSAVELDRIGNALASNDLAEAGAAAHSMKSTVAYMGFGGMFGELLNNIEEETKCQFPRKDLLKTWLDELAQLHGVAVEFLEKEFLQ